MYMIIKKRYDIKIESRLEMMIRVRIIISRLRQMKMCEHIFICVRPNIGFIKQLLEYEKKIIKYNSLSIEDNMKIYKNHINSFIYLI